MKRILIAGALALVAGGQALAADLPQAAPPPPPPRAPAVYVPTVVPTYNWGGVYLGINGGYGFGTSEWTLTGLSSGSFDTKGFLAGGQIGANFQAGWFVGGIEADLDWTDINGNSVGGGGTLGASIPLPATTTFQTKNDWLGTARVRAGVAADRVLVFVTGGAAFGNVIAGPSVAIPGHPANNSSTEFGWTAGGGVEVALAQNWTAKVEYLYVDLANGSCTTACGSPTPAPAVTFKESLIRAGVNFKF